MSAWYSVCVSMDGIVWMVWMLVQCGFVNSLTQLLGSGTVNIINIFESQITTS